MKFIHHRVGHVVGGSVVELTLKGSVANVRLMDQSNFNNYKAGRRHRLKLPLLCGALHRRDFAELRTKEGVGN